ncbi:major facilitator superfamily multidrug-resistance, DHA1 sub-family [Lentinula raphanica]|uniref:Major facilitator superfamily multidrug-resistance, DHA1 sub-family n=1 Tax=Lentinula raphanica TaxID=153919 RepID=A0AA38P1E9_9AGAR|nr:major facilitator superfamily multidrug-resistance, DHA1 sub-family [Lentinula raphanica]
MSAKWAMALVARKIRLARRTKSTREIFISSNSVPICDEATETTPLPKLQLFLTSLTQLSEPLTGMVIYPFITKAVRRTGITSQQGMRRKLVITLVFFDVETTSFRISVYPIGRASDFYGRKPLLLIGPLGLSIAMLCFGLSETFWGMVLARAAMGVFNGNIGSTDETNRADAFTFMPIVYTIGITVGPAIGGVLADPAARWPHVFGKFAFFQQYPWFLACFAAGTIAFAAFLLSCWGLKETLPRKVKPKKLAESSPLLNGSSDETAPSYGSVDEPSESPLSVEAPPSTIDLLRDPRMMISLLGMGFLAFTDMSYQVLIPLIYTTSFPVGGLGLSPYQVGLIMGIFGFANGIWNWAVLTKFLKKIGPKRTFVIGYSFFLVHFALLWVIRDVAAFSGGMTPFVWALLVFQLFVSTVIVTAFNAMHLLIVLNAPPNALGSVNGLAQVVSSGTRGLAPFFASSLYLYSLESRIAGGHLVEIGYTTVTF